MPQLPPELRVEIRKVGDQFLAVTERARGQEICHNVFTYDPDKLVHLEPQWMLEKGCAASPTRSCGSRESRPEVNFPW